MRRILEASVSALLLLSCRQAPTAWTTPGLCSVHIGEGGSYALAHEAGGTWLDEGILDGRRVFRCEKDGGRIVIKAADGSTLYDWRSLRDQTRVVLDEPMLHLAPPGTYRPGPPPNR